MSGRGGSYNNEAPGKGRQPVGFTKETCLDETWGRGGREWEGESGLGWDSRLEVNYNAAVN